MVRHLTKHSRKGHSRKQGSEVPSGSYPAHMSQPNRVGRRISPRSLAGHERLPVRLSHVASAETLCDRTFNYDIGGDWVDTNRKQTILAEVPRKSYELIRLSRVEYADSPHRFIDMRIFQRGYEDDGDQSVEVYFPTKKGVQIKENDFQKLMSKWALMPSVLIHPKVYKRAWDIFEVGKFDTATFEAFKLIEVEVRNLCGYEAEQIGTNLMRKAFNIEYGELTDTSLPRSEREAMSNLFTSAIGLYKNPHSHRDVEVKFNDAFERLLLASHLMNILDDIRERLNVGGDSE